ncbi:MAG: hypothetical protein IJY08_01190 [Clostridia bacterium]|nr:hypothetical protein [Clostridia bacterium]
MKRYIAVFLAVLISAVACLCVISGDISDEKDKIEITERTLYGDRAFALGAVVDVATRYGYHLFWNTRYTVGETGVSETEFDFYASDKRENSAPAYGGVYMYTDLNFSTNLDTPTEQLSGLSKAYREIYDECPEGQSVTRTVYLKDYYDFYPLNIRFDLPDISWTSITHSGDQLYVKQRFEEFFSIPVSADDTTVLTVARQQWGNVSATSGHNGSNYGVGATSAYADGRCFFAINIRDSLGNAVDTSHIPGGYGIYAFDFDRGIGMEDTGIDADSLSMVYSLDTSVAVDRMWMSDDGERLLILATEKGDIVFIAVDVATMETVSRLTLGAKDYMYAFELDCGVVVKFENRVVLICADNQGEYSIKIDAADLVSYDENYNNIHSSASMDYDGERLVIMDALGDPLRGADYKCSFYIAVYGCDGLLYYGEYEHSLDRHTGGSYGTSCVPNDTEAFKVSWNPGGAE